MDADNILKFLGSLDELSLCCNFETNGKISVLPLDSFNYGLFIYSVYSHRISFLKLHVKESALNNEENIFSSTTPERNIFEAYLLNIFCLPFTLLTVVCNKRNIWVIGEDSILNITSYVEQALVKSKSYEKDDLMDVDAVEEFQPNMFDIMVTVSKFKKYSFYASDIFIGCHFLDCALIRCYESSGLNMWNLDYIFSGDSKISSNIVAHTFLNFGKSNNRNFLGNASNEDQRRMQKPLIIFIHPSDPENFIFKNIFGINCISPNVICLIGHIDGKLLWSLCDSNNRFQPSHELQVLFNLKQPIVGIFFIKDLEKLKGCGFLLLVGALGQVTLISSKRYPTFTQESGTCTFWIKTVHLSSSITFCDIIKDSLLCISSNGMLLLSNLSMLFHLSNKTEDIILSSSFSAFHSLKEIIVVDRSKGLIVLETKHGNLYLTQVKNSTKTEITTSSLSSLMNECLTQSNMVQELLNKKALQSRLFAAVSKFASLKLMRNILKERMTFSITEVNEEPRKYILMINLKQLNKLNLDSELCHVTATTFTFFKNNNSFFTKSAPYKADEPTLCLELIDTVLQPPFVSIFPLFVEVGLFLHLPEKWKMMDCFKTVSSFLPFYICIQTFMVHELNLLQQNALCFPQSLKFETPKTLQIVKDLELKRPVSNILKLDSKRDLNFLKRFNLCLSVSSVQEMLGNISDSDPCKYIEDLLFSGNLSKDSISQESHITSKYSPISIHVSKGNNHIVIALTANNSESLTSLRIAVMEILLDIYKKNEPLTSSSAYVNIPASIYRKCEEISKSVMSLYGKDVETEEISNKIIYLYKELRRDISGKLPIL